MSERLGRYELSHRIGSGGMAEVFLAKLEGVQGFTRELVIKRMRPELSDRPDAVAMFLDEARLCAALHHPHIVQVSDLGEVDGTYYIAMEYVDGPHLGKLSRHLFRARTPLPPVLAAFVVDRAADGLHYAHQFKSRETGEPLNIVHRDVSPHNILISLFGDVKVADFGVAKVAGSGVETKSGVVKGKVCYMSPEQIYGEKLDARSDVFALGIVLFELLTGRRLYKHKSEMVSMQRITQEDAPACSVFNEDLSPELDRIVAKALQRDRDKRYPSMAAFEADLEAYISVNATGHCKADLARWIELHAPDIGPPRVAPHDKPTIPSRRAPAQVRKDLEEDDDDEPSAFDEGTKTTPGDIHMMRTVLEAPPRGEVSDAPPPVGDLAPMPSKDSSVSGISLSTQAFGQLKTNLSPHGSRFIGRRDDLRELHALFEGGAQFVTVLGPAGTGKTRLVLRFAERHLPELSAAGGGAWFCDLTEARTIEQLLSSVGEALRVSLVGARSTEDSIEQLGSAIGGRGRVLIILDNFEQVVDLGPQTVGHWAAGAPDAWFLITSREMLRLPGESCYELAPLGVPSLGDDVAESEAVQLFVERAQAVKPGFMLREADKPVVAEIVRKLDGIPLAIELAAARIGVLRPQKLLDRLSKRFDLLRGGSRDRSPRQATLRSAVDWSWDLLSPAERDALADCSVFRGGFSLEASEDVLDLSAHDDAPFTLDVVQALREKSLLRSSDSSDLSDDTRFSMYESVREYAGEKLDAAARRPDAERRHAGYFLELATELARGANTKEGAECRRQLKEDLQNLLAVFERATANPPPLWADHNTALQIAVALDSYYVANGPFKDQMKLLDAALTAAGGGADPALRVKAQGARGRARRRLGLIGESRTDYGEALQLCRTHKLRGDEGVIIRDLGVLASDEGRMDDALRNLQDALLVHREVHDRPEEGATLALLAFLHDELGDQQVASEFYEESLQVLREVGDRRLEGLVLGNFGGLEQERGNLESAREHIQRSFDLLHEVGDRTFEGPFLGYLGTICQEQGELDDALRWLEKAITSMRETGNLRYEGLVLGYRGTVLAGQGRLEEAEATFADAARRLREIGDPRQQECLKLQNCFLDLAYAKQEDASGNTAGAEELRQRVRQALLAAEAPGPATKEHPSGAPAPAAESDDVRRALRILKKTLAGDL